MMLHQKRYSMRLAKTISPFLIMKMGELKTSSARDLIVSIENTGSMLPPSFLWNQYMSCFKRVIIDLSIVLFQQIEYSTFVERS